MTTLSALTRRYKVGIAGCGCCGSPFLYKDGKIRGGKYEIEEKGDRLAFVQSSSKA